MKQEHAKAGTSALHYEKTGLKKGIIGQWEDGFRTGGAKGTYEWWYFDSHLDDGSELVIVFFTKPMTSPNRPLSPFVQLDLDTADGRHFSGQAECTAGEFHASKEGCDVTIGNCRIVGDLHVYDITFQNGSMEATVRLTGNVAAWRPETGQIFFGDDERHYFAWLPSIPEGSVEADITVDGQKTHYTGTGYHDHNWGNVSMLKLMNHWYWGRAKVGDYRVISSYITAQKRYGYTEFPIFMLSKGGELIADNAADCLSFEIQEEYLDAHTRKPVGGLLVYEYNDSKGKMHYRLTYRRERDIVRTRMADMLNGPLKLLAKLSGFDGAYIRFTGQATVQAFQDGQEIESVSAPAIWELMYFGHVPK